MTASHVIQIWRQHVLLGEYTWRVLRTSYRESHQWQSVDCVLTAVHGVCPFGASLTRSPNDLRVVVVHQGKPTLLEAKSFGAAEAYEFFLQILLAPVAQDQERLIRLIIPLAKGYIVRSDIIPIRLHDCVFVGHIKSFAKPLQRYENEATPIVKDDVSLPAIFAAAAACILMRPVPQVDLETVSLELDEELDNRLSFPWIITETARQRTLVLVDANSSHPEDGLGLYTAATALGISLVVLDSAGHWLGSPEYAHVCEAFIPTRLTNPPEEDMKDHILASIRAYGKPVDGIVTFADTYWPQVAEAAKVIGLPTASPEGFRIATNKYLTSKFAGHHAYRASSLDQAITVAQEHDLPYPLIIKPCGGWSSEGVYRVDTRSALDEAVRAIIASRHGPEFVIEPYCDGPEVDVNLVLQDGELLFFEVCDDLPKSADINGPSVGSLTNFHELCSVYPSSLPEAEIELLRETFLAMLLSLGLRNGVMHLEGRIENSMVEYMTEDGVMVLSPRSSDSDRTPKAWLIEINPRPLGMTGSQIIESTYGIDYWGLALLSAVGDTTRVRALARPFLKGPQYTSVMVFIPADFPSSCQGIFDSDDICADLISRRPDLEAFISRCGCLVKRGQRVPHPSTGRNTFLAYFNVYSRSSREEALNIAKQVREAVRYIFI
ncbi:hypothetical protein BDV27DRAFT_124044 [Aspergillus caelatus]|uniref:ATP-grasp domain-containing protein n=1 Tax=Aspergillus caelatus TaxID=61420 RepID=A0A5N7AE68_9EURO|nr:uncharacterized protein BDV27DRAFT_124044 [Aspergillus caelatus]KAE8367379.1 hypothetical protein BDV27DRAFT_124044 [Aspergillus caelatus]